MSGRVISAAEAREMVATARAIGHTPHGCLDDLAATVAHLHEELARRDLERDRFAAANTGLGLRVVEALFELEALRAIIKGRTTPPTDGEIAAHERAGGRWLCRSDSPAPASSEVWLDLSSASVADRIRGWRRAACGPLGSRWWALDAQRLPCAWPAAAEGP